VDKANILINFQQSDLAGTEYLETVVLQS